MAQRDPPLDATFHVITPENIAFEYRLAGPFRRLPAFVLDFCIGAALGQTEGEIAFTTLLERTSNLRMLDDQPAWRANLSFRGLTRLRLALSIDK